MVGLQRGVVELVGGRVLEGQREGGVVVVVVEGEVEGVGEEGVELEFWKASEVIYGTGDGEGYGYGDGKGASCGTLSIPKVFLVHLILT